MLNADIRYNCLKNQTGSSPGDESLRHPPMKIWQGGNPLARSLHCYTLTWIVDCTVMDCSAHCSVFQCTLVISLLHCNALRLLVISGNLPEIRALLLHKIRWKSVMSMIRMKRVKTSVLPHRKGEVAVTPQLCFCGSFFGNLSFQCGEQRGADMWTPQLLLSVPLAHCM